MYAALGRLTDILCAGVLVGASRLVNGATGARRLDADIVGGTEITVIARALDKDLGAPDALLAQRCSALVAVLAGGVVGNMHAAARLGLADVDSAVRTVVTGTHFVAAPPTTIAFPAYGTGTLRLAGDGHRIGRLGGFPGDGFKHQPVEGSPQVRTVGGLGTIRHPWGGRLDAGGYQH